jgi:riboflavin kinase/FMN adenylyltransferase
VKKKKKRGGKSSLLTFSTHPLEVIQGSAPLLIIPLEKRIEWIKSLGIDEITVLPFSKEIQEEEPESFLEHLLEDGDLKVFFLGHDTHLGKGRRGTPAFITEYLEKRGVKIVQISPFLEGNEPISSRRIRRSITEGKLDEAELLLGRRWSLFGSPEKGLGFGKGNGAPTLNFSLQGLVTPLFGVYVVKIISKDGIREGVANIGVAPTLKKNSPPLLEVHLLGEGPIPSAPYEIVPLHFLREEKQFPSVEELRFAIQEDIRNALHFFQNLYSV